MFGFHANDKKKCEKFLSDDDYLIVTEEDTQYLGTGMYFWTNKSQAEWWNAEKKNSAGGIVSCVLKQDEVGFLDLLDKSAVDKYEKLLSYVTKGIIEKYKTRVKKLGRNWNGAVGACLDAIFEAFPDVSEQVDLLRCMVKYPRKEESAFLMFSSLTIQDVEIYSARNKKPISNRGWVND